MKIFLLILFFNKTTLLTVSPINIDEDSLIIEIDKPISAITNGASLLIDISSMIVYIENKNILQLRVEVTS